MLLLKFVKRIIQNDSELGSFDGATAHRADNRGLSTKNT